MRSLLAVALSVAIAGQGAPLHARDVLRLKPSSQWHLDYAEDSCRLARKFGEGKQEVILFLDQFEPGDEFYIMLGGGDLLRPKNEVRPIKVTLRFGPHEAENKLTVDTGTMEEKRALIVSGGQRLAPLTKAEEAVVQDSIKKDGPRFIPAPLGVEREAAATWLELTKGMRKDLILETGPMDKPMAALRTCSWDTVKLWGLDVDQQKSLSRRAYPKRGPHTWFHARDYPKEMLRGGYEGIVNFRLVIDEAGRPTTCHVQKSTRPQEFDDVVCRSVMKNAQFEPALDAQGKPVPSFWRQTVYFRLEG
jgi:TonB family protein